MTATVASIQQNPFPIPGPPQGDPSYNPNYVPTQGYATNLLTVALAAVGTQPNNTTGFELLRTTLTAGQSTISSWTTVGQQRAAVRETLPPIPLAAGGLLTVQQAQAMLLPTASGLTHTLPPVSGAGGLSYHLFNPLGTDWTIAATGTDRIGSPAASGGVTSLAIPPSGSATLWGNAASGTWEVMGSQTFAALSGSIAEPFSVAPATTITQAAALGQVFASRALPLTSSKTIGASDAGAIYDVTAASVTVTLPLASSLTNQTGGIIASSVCTLNLTSGTTLEGGALEGATTVSLAVGDFVYWQAGATNWRVLSSNRAVVPPAFPSSLAVSGWKKIPDTNSPSGYLIIQWGQQSFPDIGGSENVAVVFGLAFPNALLQINITLGLTGGFNVFGMVNETAVSTTGFSAVLTETSPVVQTGGIFRWIALGY